MIQIRINYYIFIKLVSLSPQLYYYLDAETNGASATTPTSPDHETKSKAFSRFSLKKKKSIEPSATSSTNNASSPTSPSSPKQESKRKHSLTSVFRKDRKESRDDGSGSGPTSPTPNDDSTVTSPTHNKERRGSAFSRLFSHKKQNDSTTQNESSKTMTIKIVAVDEAGNQSIQTIVKKGDEIDEENIQAEIDALIAEMKKNNAQAKPNNAQAK